MAEPFIRIDVKPALDRISRSLSALAYQQLPFATSQALTALAKRVRVGERENLKTTFPTATPFTLNSVGVKPATKHDLEAVVFVKDIAAAYLEPYETGGMHKLIGRGITWLNPKSIPLDAYGNIPRSALRAYKGRKDVFIGAVKTKSGKIINGIWQRPLRGAAGGQRGRKVLAKANLTGRLKLLVRFGDPLPVRQHLGYGARAKAIVDKYFDAELGSALAKAIATSNR